MVNRYYLTHGETTGIGDVFTHANLGNTYLVLLYSQNQQSTADNVYLCPMASKLRRVISTTPSKKNVLAAAFFALVSKDGMTRSIPAAA
jgi:hypothetical protein